MFKVTDQRTGERKFTGRSKGKVLDNKDPEARGRIIVDHPLLGSTVWIDYLNAPGMFSVPDIDDVVYVECDCGYATHPIAWGNVTYGDSTLSTPTEFQNIDPTNRGFYTPSGILVELDDTPGSEGIRLTTAAGIKLNLDDVTDTVTIETVSGNKTTLDTSGIELEDNFGNTITTTETGITIKTIAGAELNLNDGLVALGNQTAELLDLVGQMLTKMTTICTDLSTTTAAGFGAPISSVAAFATLATVDLPAIQVKLTAITGSL